MKYIEVPRSTIEADCTEADRSDLLEEWDTESNLPTTPQTITHGSSRKVWWQCKKPHRWQAAVYTRTGSSTAYPYCAGKKPGSGETDFATVYPHLAKQWHPNKNLDLTPTDVLSGSHKMIWWICEHVLV